MQLPSKGTISYAFLLQAGGKWLLITRTPSIHPPIAIDCNATGAIISLSFSDQLNAKRWFFAHVRFWSLVISFVGYWDYICTRKAQRVAHENVVVSRFLTFGLYSQILVFLTWARMISSKICAIASIRMGQRMGLIRGLSSIVSPVNHTRYPDRRWQRIRPFWHIFTMRNRV